MAMPGFLHYNREKKAGTIFALKLPSTRKPYLDRFVPGLGQIKTHMCDVGFSLSIFTTFLVATDLCASTTQMYTWLVHCWSKLH